MAKTEKKILDATCGARMMWFDKNHPDALYADQREEVHTLCDGRVLEIKPDVIYNFTDMPFEDETFHLIVFDPPHLIRLGETSWMYKKYGKLFPDWRDMIKQGFDECMRVLKTNGTLVFKWNEVQVKTTEVVAVIGHKPLFGHPSGKHGRTKWMTFMKT
jgi:23S rRNA G2069 N7-methylase RlmK/C1962 C5-methylase RlmI